MGLCLAIVLMQALLAEVKTVLCSLEQRGPHKVTFNAQSNTVFFVFSRLAGCNESVSMDSAMRLCNKHDRVVSGLVSGTH